MKTQIILNSILLQILQFHPSRASLTIFKLIVFCSFKFSFCFTYLAGNKSKNIETPPSNSEESDQDEEEVKRKMDKMKNANGRTSVSAEVYGAFNKKTQFVPKVIPKSEEQNNRIRQKLQTVWMFNGLGSSEKDILIKVMEEKRYKFFY